MNNREGDKLVAELHTVADELLPLMPPEDIEAFRVLIDNCEVGVGLEMLLTQIYEHDVTVPKRAYNILEKEGSGNIDDSYFDGIQYRED